MSKHGEHHDQHTAGGQGEVTPGYSTRTRCRINKYHQFITTNFTKPPANRLYSGQSTHNVDHLPMLLAFVVLENRMVDTVPK